MNKITKKTISLLLSVILLVSTLTSAGIVAMAEDLTTGSCGTNVTYSFDSTTGTLTISGSGEMAQSSNSPFKNNTSILKVVIEDGVTSVGMFAFFGCTALTSVTIPSSVTSIGINAFSKCSGLTRAIIPNSVNEIGGGAFYGCTGLQSITLPNGVSTIGIGAFEGCSLMEIITIRSHTAQIYDRDTTFPSQATIRCCAGSTAETYAQKYDRTVETGHFWKQDYFFLPTATTTGSVHYTCESCGETTEAVANSHTINVYKKAKRTSKLLTTLNGTLYSEACEGPENGNIGICHFIAYNEDCTLLEINEAVVLFNQNVYCDDDGQGYFFCSVTVDDRRYIGYIPIEDFFVEGHRYEQTFQEATANEPGKIIYTCTKCGYVKEESTLFGICGDNAVYQFDATTGTLTISGRGDMYDYNSSSNKSPFYNNKAIKTVVVEEGVTTIGSNAFYNCSGIVSVTLPNSIKSIGIWAFFSCSALSEINLPNSIERIVERAFMNCEGLTNIVLPNSLTRIETGLFCRCYGLKSVTIPNGVRMIDASAFQDCNSLTEVTIPNTVTEIDIGAFLRCTALEKITVKSHTAQIYDRDTTFPSQATIRCCEGSTAQEYAQKYSRTREIGHFWKQDYFFLPIAAMTGSVHYTCESCGETKETAAEPHTINLYKKADNTSDILASFEGSLLVKECADTIALPSQSVNTGMLKATITGNEKYQQIIYNTDGTLQGIREGVVTKIVDREYKDKEGNAYYFVAYFTEEGSKILGYMPVEKFLVEGHRFEASHKAPTSNEPAKIVYTCTRCGFVYEESADYGICGENANYYFDAGTGTMVVSGTGSIYDYSNVASVHFANVYNQTRHVIIEDGITRVGNNTFNGFSILTDASLSDTVEVIGNDAFSDCAALQAVNVPSSLTTIGSYAFYHCAALTSNLVLPITVTAIGKGAFSGCSTLSSITVSNYEAAIGDRSSTFPTDTTLKGCTGSAAEQYASKYNRAFEGTVHSTTDETHYPTCVDGGYTEHTCMLCGYTYCDDETEPTGEHLYDEGMVIAPATETQPYNVVKYTCTVCGESYTAEIPVDGPTHIHQYTVYEVVAPTCSEEGYTVNRCDICGEEYYSDYTNPNGHQWQQTAALQPTCTEEGYLEKQCVNCGQEQTQTLPATGHFYQMAVNPPACTEQGFTVYTCTVCGDSYTADYTAPLGHQYDSYVFNDDASTYFDGTETATCARCGLTDTRLVNRNAALVTENISTTSGEEIIVPVAVKNNPGMAGFGIDVGYDASVLTPVSVTYGDVLSSNLNDSLGGNATAGTFKVMWYDENGGDMTANGVLFYVHFAVDSHASGDTAIHFAAVENDTFDEGFEPVALTACDTIISIENVSESTWYHGVLTPSANKITAGDTFYLSLDKEDSNADLTAATQTLNYDSNAFSFIGYANAAYQTVQTTTPVSNGTIRLVTAGGRTYNENNPAEALGQLGVRYLVFKSNDYATAGDYAFGYQIADDGIDEVTADGCTVTVNASPISDTAVIALPEGLTGNYSDTITVPVTITNNKGVMGYKLIFTYDASQLQIVSAACSTAFAGHFFNDTIGTDKAGSFSVIWCGTDEVSGDGTLCTLTFNVLTNQTVTSPIGITYSQDDTFNIDYDDMVFRCMDGSLRLNDNHNHQYVATVVAPTPNSKGYTEYICAVCGDTYRADETDYTSDSSALTAALAKAESVSSEDYSTVSYAALQQVCTQFEAYPDESHPQTELDAATAEILTAITNLVPYLYLTATAEHGTVTVNDFDAAERYSVLFGDSITLTATAEEGYVFDGWYETITKRIRSTEPVLTFTITSNTDFKARFIKENSAVLTFANGSGWIAAKFDKTLSEWEQVTSLETMLPRVPYKLGYTNGRWDYDNDAVLHQLRNGKSVTITPVYDTSDFTAPAVPTPTGDKPALTLDFLLDADNNIGSFTMAAGIPENCQVESIGVAFCYKKASQFNPVDFELTINNKMITSKFEATNEGGIFTVDVRKFTSYYNWAARGYVTYYDENGKLCVAYTNQINIIDRQPVADDGHTHSYTETVTEPTCTEKGYTERECTVCGYRYKDCFVEPNGHSYIADVTESTCTEGGYTTHTCSMCGDTYADGETAPAGHNWSEWISDGVQRTRTCSVCGVTETEPDSTETAQQISMELTTNRVNYSSWLSPYSDNIHSIFANTCGETDETTGEYIYDPEVILFQLGNQLTVTYPDSSQVSYTATLCEYEEDNQSYIDVHFVDENNNVLEIESVEFTEDYQEFTLGNTYQIALANQEYYGTVTFRIIANTVSQITLTPNSFDVPISMIYNFNQQELLDYMNPSLTVRYMHQPLQYKTHTYTFREDTATGLLLAVDENGVDVAAVLVPPDEYSLSVGETFSVGVYLSNGLYTSFNVTITN